MNSPITAVCMRNRRLMMSIQAIETLSSFVKVFLMSMTPRSSDSRFPVRVVAIRMIPRTSMDLSALLPRTCFATSGSATACITMTTARMPIPV